MTLSICYNVYNDKFIIAIIIVTRYKEIINLFFTQIKQLNKK